MPSKIEISTIVKVVKTDEEWKKAPRTRGIQGAAAREYRAPLYRQHAR